MLTHGGDDLNDRLFALCQPLLMLALTLPSLLALLLAVIGPGKGCTHLIHELPKALISHRHMGRITFLLNGFSAAKALACQ